MNYNGNRYMDLIETYVDRFNSMDEECYKNEITNSEALSWMNKNIPFMECSDKTIEEIYYFRWWTYRKHIRKTPVGYIITEFLADVPWAGIYNSINAANAHHLSEGRWIRYGKTYLEDYIRFWIYGEGRTHFYSTWLITAIWEYCSVRNDYSIGIENLDAICAYYEKWENEHLDKSGFFWSIDNFDAMENTISGTAENLKPDKGFRITLNSYMAADAYAISKFAVLANRNDIALKYKEKGDKLRKLIIEKLWDRDFFKSYHSLEESGDIEFSKLPPERNAREEMGYIPWRFDLPHPGMETAFSFLKCPKGFKNPFGITTAEQSHPRFLFEVNHECLWNGYIWPYATSHTLTAIIHLLHNYNQDVMSKNDFYDMLHQYANSQYIIDDNGVKRPWIDEVIDPRNGEWSSRKILKDLGWPTRIGGYERGKDYNHSTFCDLVISGLAGIYVNDNGTLDVEPLFEAENLDYFCVDSVLCGGHDISVFWDKNGGRYGNSAGLTVYCDEKKVGFADTPSKISIKL